MPQTVRSAFQNFSNDSIKGPLATWIFILLIALMVPALVFVAPLALASGHFGAAAVLYETFGFVCHQIPERSFQIAGHKLAVCSRCTGIYTGFAVGVALFPSLKSLRHPEVPHRFWLFIAALPLAADVGLGITGFWSNTHSSRFATGFLIAFVCSFYVVAGSLDVEWIFRRRRRANKAPQESAAASRGISSDYRVRT